VYILVEGRVRMDCSMTLERLSYKVSDKKEYKLFVIKINEFDTHELIGDELLTKGVY
jgi:hypothetical protein